jgi:indole-3-glycerol phosphate synthase
MPHLFDIQKKVAERLEARKKKVPLLTLKENVTVKKMRALKDIFPQDETNIIAEVKRASPSQGDIAPEANVIKIAQDYLNAGAKAVSILTEPDFFKGDLDFLKKTREQNPQAFLLMKDFIIDEYQIVEGLMAGADCILLIVAMLGEKKVRELQTVAKRLGLHTLVEVHDETEMTAATAMHADFIGINNRNLKTMQVDLQTSERLIDLATGNEILISESGLETPSQIRKLKNLGFSGFLMGTTFMKTKTPALTLKNLLADCR